MAHDIQVGHGESLGEWLQKEIVEAVTIEDAPWAIERIRRVEARLQARRPQTEWLKVEIPWWEEPTAFTAPGHYIYFSRRLYEVCATDEQVAFVVAHEIAHHDLGHVALFHGWADKIIHLPGAALFALFFHGLERLLYNPQKECAADRHGLNLCVSAGLTADAAWSFLTSLSSAPCTSGISIWSTVRMWTLTRSWTRTRRGLLRLRFGRGRRREDIFRFGTGGSY